MSKVVDRAKNSAQVLRQERARVFKAFDIYKQNVAYGVEQETQEKHNEIISWYNACLNLDRHAIENVPSEVAKYLWLARLPKVM